MPLYEYQCTRCSRRIEVIQKFSDKPKTKCPTCSGRLEKLVSAPAIQFKGTGWYVTDYGGKSGAKGSGSSSSGEGSGGKGGDAGKEGSAAGSGSEKKPDDAPKSQGSTSGDSSSSKGSSGKRKK